MIVYQKEGKAKSIYLHIYVKPTVQEILEDRPNFMPSSRICVASSRVGAKTKTVGPSRELLRRCLKWIKAGIK